jgi:hypothetical protein
MSACTAHELIVGGDHYLEIYSFDTVGTTRATLHREPRFEIFVFRLSGFISRADPHDGGVILDGEIACVDANRCGGLTITSPAYRSPPARLKCPECGERFTPQPTSMPCLKYPNGVGEKSEM